MFENTCKIIEEEVGLAFPSACLAIGKGDKILLSKSFGDADISTVFDIASVSKIISTTMIAFKFIEEGKIRLYDKLDYFFKTNEDKKDITILNLLTHTSGMSAHVYVSEYANSAEDVVQALIDLPLESPVGTKVAYSCLGYILLGKILEKIGGKTIDVLAKEMVFEPLGLHSTSYSPKGEVAPTEIDPATGELLCGVVHDENARFLNGVAGNAGVFSTIEDMTKFTQMLALEGKTAKGETYLSKIMLEEAIKNRTPGKNQEFRGLGFNLARSPANFIGDLFSDKSFGHTGFTGTSIVVDPVSKCFVVLLTNRVSPTRENPRLIRLRSLIHNSVASELSNLSDSGLI